MKAITEIEPKSRKATPSEVRKMFKDMGATATVNKDGHVSFRKDNETHDGRYMSEYRTQILADGTKDTYGHDN